MLDKMWHDPNKKYKHNDIRANRIVIDTFHLCEVLKKPPETVRKTLQRLNITNYNKDIWNKFWSLVEYLENKGLRPIK